VKGKHRFKFGELEYPVAENLLNPVPPKAKLGYSDYSAAPLKELFGFNEKAVRKGKFKAGMGVRGVKETDLG
jgi:hypothetical protein